MMENEYFTVIGEVNVPTKIWKEHFLCICGLEFELCTQTYTRHEISFVGIMLGQYQNNLGVDY